SPALRGRSLAALLSSSDRPEPEPPILSVRTATSSGGTSSVKSLNVVAIITLLVASAWVTNTTAQSSYEAEPVLQAKDLVAAELLKGPNYTVDSKVPVKGFLGRFTIRSDYGTFEAHGIHMFQVRVREVYGLAQLSQMRKTKESLGEAGQAVPRPVASAVAMVMTPVETVEGLPSGVSRLFGRIESGVQSVAAAATAPGQSGEQQVASVSE